jgi:hypothetical protein
MSPEVRALSEAFALAIHEAVRLELMEEMRAFSAGRQKREVWRAPTRRKKRKVKRPVPYDRAAWKQAVFVTRERIARPKVGNEGAGAKTRGDDERPESSRGDGAAKLVPATANNQTGLSAPAPDEPVRAVIVRIEKQSPRVALVIRVPAPGFLDVSLARGRDRRYADKTHRILDAEVLRDATEREQLAGYYIEADGAVAPPVRLAQSQ